MTELVVLRKKRVSGAWHSSRTVKGTELRETASLLSYIARESKNPEYRLNPVLKRLPARQREIVKLRFGIGYEPHTLSECGLIFEITRERVRQVQNVALSVIHVLFQQKLKDVAGKGWGQNGRCYMTTRRVESAA